MDKKTLIKVEIKMMDPIMIVLTGIDQIKISDP